MKNDDELMSAEELFGVKEVKDVRPRGARPRRVKKSAQDPLAEIKVKMVMRIYNVSRTRALEMIAGRDAEKKALEAGAASERAEDDDGELMSAADFFGACD